MENWIFITILGAIVAGAANSHTIVYPGKSALLSYSPARGEFPVESLFGRGYFSYIDDRGISRTVSLEPNPLLGVRVSGDNGKLSADLGNSVELRNDGHFSLQKGDRLKPIKEFDERPFQHNLDEKDMSFLGPSIVLDSSSKLTEQPKGDQEKLSLVIPQTVTAPVKGVVVPPGNTYLPPQNTPSLMFSNQPIVSKPSTMQGVFNPQNPFLNQPLGIPVKSPSLASNIGAAQQPIATLPAGQVFFFPSTVPIKSGAVPTSSGLAPQLSTDQFLIFPQKPIGGIAPASNELPEIKPELVLKPISHVQPISAEGGQSSSGSLPNINSGTITPEVNKEQVYINPAPISLTPSSTSSPETIIPPQQASNQGPGQIVSNPSVPISFATPAVINLPGSETPLLSKPQEMPSKPLPPTTNLPGLLPGKPFFPPFPKYPIEAPTQEIFMIRPGNPFLSFNNNKDKPLSRPTPTTTTSAPIFNADNKNPFLTNSFKPDVKFEVPKIQPIAVIPSPQLVPAPAAAPALPASTSCKYNSVGKAPEQIKDTPEVEQAKRDHFLAHELALAQLAQARQNNDNTNLPDESSLALTSSGAAADNSLLYLPPNAPLDQLVTSGPTIMTFEQTTTVKAV